MQKIFSQELRFKDDNGNNYPDWEEKKLGDIGEFKTSSVDKLIKENEKMVSLINYMNVYNHQNITNEITKDLMQVSAKEKQIETSTLKRGDILFTPSSETPSDIGHSIVIFEDLYNTLYSYHLMRFRPIIKLDILYSHYFCNIPSVLRQITRFATGSTRFTISVGSFSKIIIQLPSFDEQQKIANFLSSLDSKIALVSTQIENTKAFKKGLLQQMFV
jgi:type I restriction enzyme S subunit